MDSLSLLMSVFITSDKNNLLGSLAANNSTLKMLGGKVRTISALFRICLAVFVVAGQVSCSLISSQQTDSISVPTPNSAELNPTQPSELSLGGGEQDLSWLLERIQAGRLSPPKHQLSDIKGLFRIGRGSKALLLAVDRVGLITVLDPLTDRSFELKQLGAEVGPVAFLPSLGILAVSTGTEISVLKLAGLETISVLTRLKSRAVSLAFAPDGQALLIGGSDARIYRWRFNQHYQDLSTNDRALNLETYFGLSSPVSSLDFHPTGRVFFSADWSGGLSAWLTYDSDKFSGEYDQNLLEGSMFGQRVVRMKTARDGPDQIEKAQVIDQGQFILTGTSTGSIELWRTRGLVSLGAAKAHQGVIHDIAFELESNRVATSARDGRVRVWKLDVGQEVFDQPQHFSLSLIREFETGVVKSLIFFSSDVLYAGKSSGEILRLDLSK